MELGANLAMRKSIPDLIFPPIFETFRVLSHLENFQYLHKLASNSQPSRLQSDDAPLRHDDLNFAAAGILGIGN